jgi:hypothetical protein
VSVVHVTPSSQFGAEAAVQPPLWQVSRPLHALPSEHAVPLPTTTLTHAPVLHTSAVHALLSSHWAFVVHARQPGMGVWAQPLVALHESMVHASLSLQSSGSPGAQLPP